MSARDGSWVIISPKIGPSHGTQLITPEGIPVSCKILYTQYLDNIVVSDGFQRTTFPISAGAEARLPPIAVKLKGHTYGTSTTRICFIFRFVIHKSTILKNHKAILPSMNIVGPLIENTSTSNFGSITTDHSGQGRTIFITKLRGSIFTGQNLVERSTMIDSCIGIILDYKLWLWSTLQLTSPRMPIIWQSIAVSPASSSQRIWF